jgi:hypothetical protein
MPQACGSLTRLRSHSLTTAGARRTPCAHVQHLVLITTVCRARVPPNAAGTRAPDAERRAAPVCFHVRVRLGRPGTSPSCTPCGLAARRRAPGGAPDSRARPAGAAACALSRATATAACTASRAASRGPAPPPPAAPPPAPHAAAASHAAHAHARGGGGAVRARLGTGPGGAARPGSKARVGGSRGAGPPSWATSASCRASTRASVASVRLRARAGAPLLPGQEWFPVSAALQMHSSHAAPKYHQCPAAGAIPAARSASASSPEHLSACACPSTHHAGQLGGAFYTGSSRLLNLRISLTQL